MTHEAAGLDTDLFAPRARGEMAVDASARPDIRFRDPDAARLRVRVQPGPGPTVIVLRDRDGKGSDHV